MLEHGHRMAVTDQGVVIPKAWFGTATEVELREENGRLVLSPVTVGDEDRSGAFDPSDPIWTWGADAKGLGITDASVNLDKYIYDDPHGMGG
ncbi:MAG: AbrB/MazE/SpoVT family DNA-binding domain-containing protein [Pirellulales bacterium]|nr:AbrB/MazE/SpoVT family DNA-binding domain-containing protein [Pirellulales bacterium]